jgi:hypothetical protein
MTCMLLGPAKEYYHLAESTGEILVVKDLVICLLRHVARPRILKHGTITWFSWKSMLPLFPPAVPRLSWPRKTTIV